MADPAFVRRAPGQALPVLVLTGFLGAGKTTLLNYLLSGLSGARVAALVNDFGAVEVDALNIAGRVDSTISLAGGCMCCEVDVDEVDQALADLAAPEQQLDLVVIEASGLAEPDVLAQMVRGQPRTTISYAGLINVVDAVHFREVLDRHPRLEQHLAISDLLVVTKSDLLDAAGRAEFAAFLRERAGGVPVVTAEYGRLDLGLLFGSVDDDRCPAPSSAPAAAGPSDPAGQPAPAAGHEHSHAHGHDHDHSPGHAHLHDSYGSFVAESAEPLHPRRFMLAMRRMPAGVYRAKGTVVLAGEDGPWSYRVNVVGKMLDLEAEGPCETGRPSQLVLIGVDVDEAEAVGLLAGAVTEAGEIIRPEDRFGLEPYLIAPPDASDASGWIYEEERSAPLTGESQMLFDPDDPDFEDPTQTP